MPLVDEHRAAGSLDDDPGYPADVRPDAVGDVAAGGMHPDDSVVTLAHGGGF